MAFPAASGAQRVPASSTFRVFLQVGEALPSFGEPAIVGDRVVFTLLVGGETDARRRYELVNLPAAAVDVERTVAYAEALRAAYYAATRGEADYAEMTGDVSRTLDALPGISDPDERLRAAEAAHARLLAWSRVSHGYRADDLEALEDLFVVVLAELRRAAGAAQLAMELSARSRPGGAETLQAAPDTREAIRLALVAAGVADEAAERKAILASADAVLADEPALAELRNEVRARLAGEASADAAYASLSAEILRLANEAVDRGDAEDILRLAGRLAERDRHLGGLRPRLVRDLARQLELKAVAARAHRAAVERYAALRPAFLGYERRVRPVLVTVDGLKPILSAVRDMRFTSFDRLRAASDRLNRALDVLLAVEPPEDLADVHATLASAVHLAREAVARRLQAAATASEAASRDGSSAAAGSALLLERARGELVARLFPPQAR